MILLTWQNKREKTEMSFMLLIDVVIRWVFRRTELFIVISYYRLLALKDQILPER